MRAVGSSTVSSEPWPNDVLAMLAHRAAATPSRMAFERPDGSALTFRHLYRDALEAGLALRESGISRGERVALMVSDAAAFCTSYFAVSAARAVPVAFPADLGPRDGRALLTRARPAAVIAQGATPSWCDAPVVHLSQLAAFAPASVSPAPSPHRLAHVVCSSGTTALPKLVEATHSSALGGFGRPLRHGPGHRVMHSLPPWSFVNIQGAMLGGVYAGTTSVCVSRFEPSRFQRAIIDRGCDAAYLTPGMIGLLGANSALPVAPRVRVLWVVGAAMTPAHFAVVRRLYPRAAALTLYALTEGGSALVSGVYDPAVPTRIGHPTGGTRVIVGDECGASQPPGVTGEILVQVVDPAEADGRPAEPVSESCGDWTRTGDLGFIDAAGALHVCGRRDDVINSGGVKILPAEVERVLLDHPQVTDAAVVAVPDALRGSVAVGAIVAAGSLRTHTLRQWVRSHLAASKVPVRFVVLPELPRNAAGKLLRTAVTERLSATLNDVRHELVSARRDTTAESEQEL